jgi:hypothetical protein
MFEASKNGDEKEVLRLIENGNNDWNTGLCGACKGGHRSLVDLMIEKGADDWNRGLYGACYGGHRSLVDLMIEKGADDWDEGLWNACEGGYRSLAELMIEKGATDWNKGLWGVCYCLMTRKESRDYFLAKYMIEKGATIYHNLNIPTLVESMTEDELIPFSQLPHLLPELKKSLVDRVKKYHEQTRELTQKLSSLPVIIPDLVKHILVPYIRHI